MDVETPPIKQAVDVTLPKPPSKPWFPIHVRGYEISKVKFAIIVIGIILLIGIISTGFATNWTFKNSEGFIGPFSLWGTPDWEIRNKGHKHQERSDSHVSKPKNKEKNWSISEFKKSVRELNKKASN